MNIPLSFEELQNTPVRIHCPIRGVIEIAPPDLEEIAPLVAHLQSDRPVEKQTQFPRGTVMPDGRLDLCKQSVGALGCRLITDALAGNTTITSLLLGTDGIGDAGAEDVARLISHNPRLETVYLGCNFIGPKGAAQIADALAANASVTGLWLKRNPLGTEGVKCLADMLRHNRTLRVLDMVDTAPGQDGMTALLDVLTYHNRTLERVYLGGCRITPDHARQIGMLLRQNATLKALMLNVNTLGDVSMSWFADGLQHNHTLEELGLASNGVTHEGASVLLPVVGGHTALRSLDLGYSASTQVLGAQANRLGDAGAEMAGEMLRRNSALRRLNLRRNGIREAGRASLCAGLEVNTHLFQLDLDDKPDPQIMALLSRNRAQGEDWNDFLSRDVSLIRSVYRVT